MTRDHRMTCDLRGAGFLAPVDGTSVRPGSLALPERSGALASGWWARSRAAGHGRLRRRRRGECHVSSVALLLLLVPIGAARTATGRPESSPRQLAAISAASRPTA